MLVEDHIEAKNVKTWFFRNPGRKIDLVEEYYVAHASVGGETFE